MSELMKRDVAYAAWVKELKERYCASQIKASIAVNSEMLRFYWTIGRDIAANDADNVYGSGFFLALSSDLGEALPGVKGLSPRNLRYMKSFYELFSDAAEILPQAVAKSAPSDEDAILPQAAAESPGGVERVVDLLSSIHWGHMRLIVVKRPGDTEKVTFCAFK